MSTTDEVVDELRREFPEWCTHRHTWMSLGMHREDRAAVGIFEGAANWYLFGDDSRAFISAVDAAEHATGLVRLSRRSPEPVRTSAALDKFRASVDAALAELREALEGRR